MNASWGTSTLPIEEGLGTAGGDRELALGALLVLGALPGGGAAGVMTGVGGQAVDGAGDVAGVLRHGLDVPRGVELRVGRNDRRRVVDRPSVGGFSTVLGGDDLGRPGPRRTVDRGRSRVISPRTGIRDALRQAIHIEWAQSGVTTVAGDGHDQSEALMCGQIDQAHVVA